MRELFLIALIVACPLMMMWMMRGGHGRSHDSGEPKSIAELRRERDELEGLIEEREAEEESTPVGGGWR
jgi:hypothetical protein